VLVYLIGGLLIGTVVVLPAIVAIAFVRYWLTVGRLRQDSPQVLAMTAPPWNAT
jgi:hypothetical protein